VARRNDLIDKGGPVVRPFLLQDRHKNQVELVEERALGVQALLGAGEFDDEVDDKVPDTYFMSFVESSVVR